jgi:hypothetical protein
MVEVEAIDLQDLIKPKGEDLKVDKMARVDIVIPEPSAEYTQENQRQVSQSLQTLKDKLNTSYQRELKNEQDTFNYFLS